MARLIPFSLTLLLLTLDAADAQEPFSARVESVMADGLRIVSPEGSQLVALYGVVIDDHRSPSGKLAKDFVKSNAEGAEVTINPKKVLAGLKYVEVVLPGGGVLNEELLARGLARLDTVTAFDNARYEELEKSARDAEIGIWGKRVSASPPAEARPSPGADSKESIERFNARRELRRIAEFDAQFFIWSGLPPDYRKMVRLQYEQNLLASRFENERRVAASQEAIAEAERLLSENNRQIQEQQVAIAQQYDAESARLGDLYNDPDFLFNTGVLNAAVQNRQVAVATQQRSVADASRYVAWEFSRRAEDDVARLNQEAAAVSVEHEMIRQEHRAAIDYLSAEQAAIQSIGAQAEARTRAASQMANSQDRRLSEALARLDTLDRAIEQKYKPQTKAVLVEKLELAPGARPVSITIDTDLWQLNWRVTNFEPGASLAFDVESTGARASTRRISTNRPPHEAFELIDGPGQFRLVPKLSGNVAVTVQVFTLVR